jgi:FG-GAP-like repeat
MAPLTKAALRAAAGTCALFGLALLAACEGDFGTSPPHAAPADPVAEAADGQVELSWGEVTDATQYVILWENDGSDENFDNEITGIEDTSFVHEGLTNLELYRYKVVAETSGGRGPESVVVSATPGPVPDEVEWAAVIADDPGHTIHFAEVEGATHYRVYFAQIESQLDGRRPNAPFDEADESPLVREDIGLLTALYYRVFAMNDTRIGTGSTVAVSPTFLIGNHDLPFAGLAIGDPNDDTCQDLPTGDGTLQNEVCAGNFEERDLDETGLGDLIPDDRSIGDARFADFTGDGVDDLFSNTQSPANDADSIALLHVSDGEGNYETSAQVSGLEIGGFGGTLLAADFDNDGDVDVFAPNDQTRGDGARNWLLVNDGSGVLTDQAVAAGVDSNPAGDAFVPGGGQAVDFNEDGFVDLLFGSRLLLNDGDGTFSDGSGAAGVPVLADQGLKLADIDLDGDLDLIHHDGSVTRLFDNTGGTFDAGTVVHDDPRASFGAGLAVCDVNADGFEDVMIPYNLRQTGIGVPRLFINVAGTLTRTQVQDGTGSRPNGFHGLNNRMACADPGEDLMTDLLVRWDGVYRLFSAARVLENRFRVRVVGADGERNQQGRIVRAVPRRARDRIITRVVESGSGFRSQSQYDLLIGSPWPGTYDVTVGFADGEVTTTAVAGDLLTIFADGTVENDRPDDEEE